jgi:hypothetical protein
MADRSVLARSGSSPVFVSGQSRIGDVRPVGVYLLRLMSYRSGPSPTSHQSSLLLALAPGSAVGASPS